MTEPQDLHPAFPRKMPFEDRVLRYLKANPGATYGQCSQELGIGLHAIEVAIASLQDKGIVAAVDEAPPEESPP